MIDNYSKLLKQTGLSKRDLSNHLGITDTTVYRWGNNPPKYAIVYLESLALNQTLTSALSVISNNITLTPDFEVSNVSIKK